VELDQGPGATRSNGAWPDSKLPAYFVTRHIVVGRQSNYLLIDWTERDYRIQLSRPFLTGDFLFNGPIAGINYLVEVAARTRRLFLPIA